MWSSGWRVRRDLGGKELMRGGTWVQQGAGQEINSEGGGANSFCVYGRKGKIERI